MIAQWNYDTIKALASDTPGLKVTDLLALARNNDPFYAGTPADWDQARWFADIWERAGYSSGVHLRRVHYWCVSQNPPLIMPSGKPYENTDHCWSYLGQASKMARYLGLVQIANIVDRKNPDPHIYAQYTYWWRPGYDVEVPDLTDLQITAKGFNSTHAQPYHLEVWCEKSTMDDVLTPVCVHHDANLVTFEGEASITAVCVGLARRIAEANKPARIFYISDFDPAGNSMPVATARKIEWAIRTRGHDWDVKLLPLALTADQVKTYRLPRTPIKETERRAARFEDAFGTGAVELDALEALHPGELADLVRGALAPYYSDDKEAEVRKAERALEAAVKEQVDAITDRYQAEIAALETMVEEIRAIKVDMTPFEVALGKPDAPEDDTPWLYDSTREYLQQLENYKAHKNGNGTAGPNSQ